MSFLTFKQLPVPDTSHMWQFTCKLKPSRIKLQFLSHTGHTSSDQQAHIARGCHAEWLRSRIITAYRMGSITADHETKRRSLLGRKVMTNLDSILKNRDVTLPTKALLVKSMVFHLACMDMRVGL